MEEFIKLRNIALPISAVNRNLNRSTCEEKESLFAKNSAKDEENILGLETETKNLEFISFAEELFSINDKDLNIVLEVIDARHRVNIHDRKTEEVVTATETLVTGILHAAGELDTRFKSSCIYSGSFYDDLKVGNADEFDFVARIDSLSQQDVLEARRSKRKRGFVYLVVKDKAVQDHFAEFLTTPDDDPCLKKTDMILNVNAFQEHFIDLIFSAIQSIDIPDNFIPTEKDGENEVTEISWRPHRNGPCATLYLTYICQSTSDVVNIDIDIAPSIAYPGREYEPPVIEILSGSQPSNPFLDIVHDITYASEVMLVPFHFDYTEKSSERSWHYLYSDTWRVSHSSIEKAVFSLFNPGDTEKRLCRILKILKEIHLQGTKEIEQESKSGPLKLLEPPSTRLTSCTVEAVSEISYESEYETDWETDDEEFETVTEESDDEQCEINYVELDDENCEADEEKSYAELCETVAEELDKKESETVAEESDNKECETVAEESDNKECESVGEESNEKENETVEVIEVNNESFKRDISESETIGEESDNKECETVAEESDNKECETVGEESDEKENETVEVIEVNNESFKRDFSESETIGEESDNKECETTADESDNKEREMVAEESDNKECEAVGEELDEKENGTVAVNEVNKESFQRDISECETSPDESDNKECETVAEESDNKECETVAEESDNKECETFGEKSDENENETVEVIEVNNESFKRDISESETIGEESDNKVCETIAEESDNKECEMVAEESDNKECETVGEESDNKESETVGEESDEKENETVEVIEVHKESFQRDISEDGLGINEQNTNLLKVHSNKRYDITVEKANEMNTEDIINCVASNRSDTTKTDIDSNPCSLGVPFSQSTDRMVEIIYDRVSWAHYDDPLRANTATSRTSYDEPNKPIVEYKIGHFSDNIDSVKSNPPGLLELGPPSATLYARHPPVPNSPSSSLTHTIDSHVIVEYPNDRCQQSKQYVLAPALQQEDINRIEDINYRDSKPLLKTYMIKMLFLAMKTAYPDTERWEPNQLSSLLKMALCMIYYAYSSPEKGILNFWFQDLIENRVRDSTCQEVLLKTE